MLIIWFICPKENNFRKRKKGNIKSPTQFIKRVEPLPPNKVKVITGFKYKIKFVFVFDYSLWCGCWVWYKYQKQTQLGGLQKILHKRQSGVGAVEYQLTEWGCGTKVNGVFLASYKTEKGSNYVLQQYFGFGALSGTTQNPVPGKNHLKRKAAGLVSTTRQHS